MSAQTSAHAGSPEILLPRDRLGEQGWTVPIREPPSDERIKPVRGVDDLRRHFRVMAPLIDVPIDPEEDRRWQRLLDHLPTDRELMLVAVGADEGFRGAAFGYRVDPRTVKLQALAVTPDWRRRGVASRLLGRLEVAAGDLGCTTIVLGLAAGARPFYEACGYSGRGATVRKSLAGRALTQDRTARRLRLAELRLARDRRRGP